MKTGEISNVTSGENSFATHTYPLLGPTYECSRRSDDAYVNEVQVLDSRRMRSWPDRLTLEEMIKGCSPQLGHFFTCADAAYELRISVRPSVSQMGGPKSNKTAMADMICRLGPKEPTYYTCDSRWNGETVDYVMPYDPKAAVRRRYNTALGAPSSGSIDCACAVRAERRTSSYWPPPPKTCGNWRSSSPSRRRSSPHEAKGSKRPRRRGARACHCAMGHAWAAAVRRRTGYESSQRRKPALAALARAD